LATKQPVFLYDADCGLCSAFKRVASRLDASHRVRFLSIQEGSKLGVLDSVPPRLWYASSHMAKPDGTLLSGADSVVELLSLLPAGRFPARFLSTAPVGLSSARWVYSVVLRQHGASCASRALLAHTHQPELSTEWSLP